MGIGGVQIMIYEEVIDKDDLLRYGVEYTVGIFYKDISWAKSVYDILYRKLNAAIHTCRRNRYHMDITLHGGMRYLFIHADANARGYKFNRIYLQPGINQDYIDDIIVPSLVNQDKIITIV